MWLFGIVLAIVAVSLAYYLPAGTSDPWTALNTAAITAGMSCLLLLAATLRKPFPVRTRLLAWTGALIVGIAIAVSWTVTENQSRYQAAAFAKVREQISCGVIAQEISTPLLSALQQYYTQQGKSKKTLGQVFRQANPRADIGRNIHLPSYEGDKLIITVAGLSEHEVLLIAEEGYVRGKNADFRNLSGGTGMVQERARLTLKGIAYESEN